MTDYARCPACGKEDGNHDNCDLTHQKPLCPDCGHSWAIHHDKCTEPSCDCKNRAIWYIRYLYERVALLEDRSDIGDWDEF